MSFTSMSTPSTTETVEKMLKIRWIVMLGALLPGVGCFACIIYTYIFQYDKLENLKQSENCPDVKSTFPPASYSIGVWAPQKFFFLLVLLVHIPPRTFFLILYRRLFLNAAPKSTFYSVVLRLYMKTLWMEPIGLVLLTVVDIQSYFVVHALGYAIWLLAFCLNMFFNILLYHYGGIRETDRVFEMTWRLKVFMLVTGALLAISTGISYPLFTTYCSSVAQLAFALAECILIAYNSIFYCLVYWDFPKTRVTVGILTGSGHPMLRTVSTSPIVEKISINSLA